MCEQILRNLNFKLQILTFEIRIFQKNFLLNFQQILDEVQRIMRYIRHTSNQPPKGRGAYIFMEDELFDLTTMAMEYFKEHIEPTLPEITYFGADFLDFTSFASKFIYLLLCSRQPYLLE